MGAAVLGLCCVLAVLGATRTGITTDEPIHVMRLRNYFDTGWYALDWDFSGAGPGAEGTNTFVYGPVAMLVLHAWSVLWGVEGWRDVATSPQAYDVRHLGVVATGLVGEAAVAAMARVVLGRWRWGLVAAAVLAAVPMWTGHLMFNVKDVPVATGYTAVTLALLVLVGEQRPRARLRWARAGCLAGGLVLTLGTRPGMWSGIFASMLVAIVGVLHVARSRPESRRAVGWALAELTATCLVAAAALVAIYPRLFGAPLRALPRSTEASSSFLDGLKSDRLYVPRHVAEEMPTLLLGFVLVGAVAGAVALWAGRRGNPVPSTRLALVGVQAFALPVIAIILGSDLYHGLRQLLFAAPAVAVLAAYGMASAVGSSEEQSRGRRRLLATAGAVAALVLPVVDQVTLQPYQTTYVNLATDLVTTPFLGAAGRPGGDFWRASLPELLDHQHLDRQLLCKSTVDPLRNVAFPFTDGGEAFSTSRSIDCREEANGPLSPQRLPVVREPPADEYDAVFLEALPSNCRLLNEVTRFRHGFDIVVTVLARCTVTPAPLTAGGVRATDPALGTTAPGDLWRFAVDGWERWPGRGELTSPVSEAVLTFAATGDCRRTACILTLEGTWPADLVVSIAGDQVRARIDDHGTLRIPVTTRQASNPHGVWLSLTRRSGSTLEARLTSMSLAPPDTARTRRGST